MAQRGLLAASLAASTATDYHAGHRRMNFHLPTPYLPLLFAPLWVKLLAFAGLMVIGLLIMRLWK